MDWRLIAQLSQAKHDEALKDAAEARRWDELRAAQALPLVNARGDAWEHKPGWVMRLMAYIATQLVGLRRA